MQQSFNTPFLRWAGGKTWLARQLEALFSGLEFQNYHEPFLGSGAIFFSLCPTSAYLSDSNAFLIQTYQLVRDRPEDVIRFLAEFENTRDAYYRIRETVYEDAAQGAAQFIYLNRTSFNGIYRVNLKGKYNVPYGGEGKKHFEPEVIRAASEALKHAKLFARDFHAAAEDIGQGDLVFLDPPYTVSHNKNGFIKYNQKLFTLDDQHRLSRFIDMVIDSGAKFILSNADHEVVRNIFEHTGEVRTVSRQSLLGGRQAKRGRTNEIIVSNAWGD